MTSKHKHIANKGFEEASVVSTRDHSHGPGKGAVRIKRIFNRSAKKDDARFHFSTFEA